MTLSFPSDSPFSRERLRAESRHFLRLIGHTFSMKANVQRIITCAKSYTSAELGFAVILGSVCLGTLHMLLKEPPPDQFTLIAAAVSGSIAASGLLVFGRAYPALRRAFGNTGRKYDQTVGTAALEILDQQVRLLEKSWRTLSALAGAAIMLFPWYSMGLGNVLIRIIGDPIGAVLLKLVAFLLTLLTCFAIARYHMRKSRSCALGELREEVRRLLQQHAAPTLV